MKIKIPQNSKLCDLEIPFLDVVLEEVFLVSKTKTDLTIEELSSLSLLKIDEITRRLREIKRLSVGLEITRLKIKELEKPFYLEVSFPKAKKKLKKEFNPAFFLSESGFKDGLLKIKKHKGAIILISEELRKSFSAAIYLKQQGFTDIYTLKDPGEAYVNLEI